MLQLMKPARSTPPIPEIGDGAGAGTSRRGDATYAQTDYLSHKSVMSLNASSGHGAKYSNGGETASPQDCQPAHDQPTNHGMPGLATPTNTTPPPTTMQQPHHPQQEQYQRHQAGYYYDQTHLGSAASSQPPPQSVPIKISPQPDVDTSSRSHGNQSSTTKMSEDEHYPSPMEALNNISYDLTGQQGERQKQQHRANQMVGEASHDLAGRKEQSQTSCTTYRGETEQKDYYNYRSVGEAPTKAYPLSVPQFAYHSQDRTDSNLSNLPVSISPSSSSRPPSYPSGAPQQEQKPSIPADGPSQLSMGGMKLPCDSFHNNMNKADSSPGELIMDIKTESDAESDKANQKSLDAVRTAQMAGSPAKNGDEAPATHSDSGIVHDGGSNTSSNSGSSGDHDDSATGGKIRTQSPPSSSYPYDHQAPSPTSASDLNKSSGALSSPFLTAPMPGVSSASSPSMAELKERLASGSSSSSSDGKGSSSNFPPMPPFSHSPTSSIPRPLNMPLNNPLGLSFMTSGGGVNMGDRMTPPRAPLTPGSARSMSPPEIPPVIEGGKEVYFCHLCSYVGNSKFHFNQHMNSHFEHRCPHCDYTSRTEGRLKRHIKDFHSEIPPDNYSGTRTQRTLPPRPKVYKCKQCDFSSVTKIDFWEHSRCHIKDDKVLQCPKCPFVTEYKHHLEYHLRNHFGSKPFKCPKCNYACVNKSMLNSHMKSHTNVYQYRCSDCTYATKYCHSLKLHLKKYNHKPATVLNPDGSLPTDGSGDFELVSKRGPPRGPRGPRKDQPPGQPPSMMNPMIMPPMPGMNGLPPPPSMLPGYWPMMPPINGSIHPPPPLIPASSAHLNPFNPGLPSHMSPSIFSQDRDRQEGSDSQGSHDGRSMTGEDRPTSAGERTKTPIKCVLCDFKADQRASLNEHMIKVHAAENQDLLNVFNVHPDSLTEDHNRAASKSSSEGSANQPELSETAATPIKQEDTSSNGQSSPPLANQAWIMNTSQPSARKSTPGEAFPSPMFQSTPQGIPTPQQMDMMQHQMLKERYNAAIAAEIAQNIEAEAKVNGESPLDLTKRKEQFQQQLAAHQMLLNPGFMMSHFQNMQNMQKRKFDAISMVAMHAAAAVGGQEQDSGSPPMDNSMTPRKRSRKGKAYKLDTICQKLQERYGDSPSPGDSNDGDTSDSALTGSSNMQQHGGMTGTGGDDSEEQIDYSAIHRSLSELNSQASLNTYHTPGGEPKQIKTEDDKGAQDTNNPSTSSSTSSTQQTGTINRRKLFMVRHHEQLQQQQLQREAAREDEEENSRQIEDASTSRASGSPEEDRSSTPPYECSHCAITFRDCIMYTVHMGYHGYQDPFKCNMCGHVSRNRVEFFLHIARAAHE